MLDAMEDLGQPSSYLALEKGVAVYSSDGKELGRVARVLSAPNIDVFDGFVLDTTVLPGGHRFVDGPEVAEIYERGVVLKIDAAAAENLPAPTANPGALRANPGDFAAGSESGGSLRRAWRRLIGRG
jgi:hypothetical protein